MRCPKCMGTMEDDGTCSCGYRKNKVVALRENLPTLCAWSDHGRSCPCRGIMSEGTSGNGQWYCREHWERLHRRDPLETGNAIPEMPKSRAVIEWRAQWKARFGDKKIVQDKPIPNPLEAA
jgi:hypothetical protein